MDWAAYGREYGALDKAALLEVGCFEDQEIN